MPATEWGPVFRSDAERQSADIVNLGFVLNVIEDADERRKTLKSAFALARKVLIVGVMLGYQSKPEQFAAYEDEVRTQRNTFQKYYGPGRVPLVRQKTLGANAIPIAAGICLVFRDTWKSSCSCSLGNRSDGSGGSSGANPIARPSLL